MDDKLNVLRQYLLAREPFYFELLGSLDIEPHPDVTETIAAGIRADALLLCYSPIFFDSHSLAQQLGVIEHEILHIACGHLRVPCPSGNRVLWNIACDLAANTLISVDRLPLGALLPWGLRLPEGLGAAEYLARLERGLAAGNLIIRDVLRAVEAQGGWECKGDGTDHVAERARREELGSWCPITPHHADLVENQFRSLVRRAAEKAPLPQTLSRVPGFCEDLGGNRPQ